MTTGRQWGLLIAALTVWWVASTVAATIMPFGIIIPILLISYLTELVLMAIVLTYLWRVYNEVKGQVQWVLWLFIFSAAIMLFGLLPATLLLVAYITTPDVLDRTVDIMVSVDIGTLAVLFLATSTLFIGAVPIVTAYTIWRRRQR